MIDWLVHPCSLPLWVAVAIGLYEWARRTE